MRTASEISRFVFLLVARATRPVWKRIADASPFNPLIRHKFRHRSAYTWPNLALAAGVLIAWGGHALRLGEQWRALRGVRAMPPEFRETGRALADASFTRAEEAGQKSIMVGVATVLAVGALYLWRACALWFSRREIVSDEMRSTPLTSGELLAGLADWPQIKCLCALTAALAPLMLGGLWSKLWEWDHLPGCSRPALAAAYCWLWLFALNRIAIAWRPLLPGRRRRARRFAWFAGAAFALGLSFEPVRDLALAALRRANFPRSLETTLPGFPTTPLLWYLGAIVWCVAAVWLIVRFYSRYGYGTYRPRAMLGCCVASAAFYRMGKLCETQWTTADLSSDHPLLDERFLLAVALACVLRRSAIAGRDILEREP